MSVILGINTFHADSAACLVVDGVLRWAIAEERLGDRLKHSPRFPTHAVRRVLAEEGLKLSDVTHVALARNPRSNLAAKTLYSLSRPFRAARAIGEHLRRNRKTSDLRARLAQACDTDPSSLRFEIVPVEHHLAHVASAYYLSPFEGLAAGWSYDASGDFVSAMAARCQGTSISPIHRVFLPHSLGFFYTAVCQFIGFDRFGEEYKVMGLAAYGKDAYAHAMERMISLPPEGWYRLSSGYFGMHEGGESGALDTAGHIVAGRFYTDRFRDFFGDPRPREAPLTDREKDLARSCQERFEQAARHCLRHVHRLVPSDRLVLAGGCALNGVANASFYTQTPFQHFYIQPAASDDGTCLGAAYYTFHSILGGRTRCEMTHPYWGPQYSQSVLKQAAECAGFPYRAYEEPQLLDTVARLLHEGKIIGWYQGRSEWGPRALGNRSILANPTRPDMVEILNRKIKRRELFRPFAPTVLREAVPAIFEQNIHSPFMMHVVNIRPQWRTRLPAVTHVDGTGRLQSLERDMNGRYYDLIRRFCDYSGVPVLLNTSFNENEPIVDTPDQAVSCFKRTDMDVLVLGRFVVEKPADRPGVSR